MGCVIAIVGGGVAGVSAAHRLALAHDVTLFRQERVIVGTTGTVGVTLKIRPPLAFD